MSYAGPWLTPTGTYTVRGARVGRVVFGGDGFTPYVLESGDTRPSNSGTFSGQDYVAASFHGLGGRSFSAGLLQVLAQPMSGRVPEDFGAVTPVDAVGFEWEDPTALAVPGDSVIPASTQLVDVTLLGDVRPPMGSVVRPPIPWSVRVGFIPPDGIVTAASGTVRAVTAAPGLTGPAQFPAVEDYELPGGSGDLTGYVTDADYTVSIPSEGTSGWAVVEVMLAAVAAGAPAPSTYSTAETRLQQLRSGQTPYAPASRYRWLYDGDPPVPTTGTYGWGLRLV